MLLLEETSDLQAHSIKQEDSRLVQAFGSDTCRGSNTNQPLSHLSWLGKLWALCPGSRGSVVGVSHAKRVPGLEVSSLWVWTEDVP